MNYNVTERRNHKSSLHKTTLWETTCSNCCLQQNTPGWCIGFAHYSSCGQWVPLLSFREWERGCVQETTRSCSHNINGSPILTNTERVKLQNASTALCFLIQPAALFKIILFTEYVKPSPTQLTKSFIFTFSVLSQWINSKNWLKVLSHNSDSQVSQDIFTYIIIQYHITYIYSGDQKY